jgi:hypothetical protein
MFEIAYEISRKKNPNESGAAVCKKRINVYKVHGT